MTKDQYFEFLKNRAERRIAVSRAKNADYSAGADPFANFTRVEALGICSVEQGFLVRMVDKMSRISSFVERGELSVKDESVDDTLLDLANYADLLAAYIESQKVTKPFSVDLAADSPSITYT
jgi:hypothetical protein